MLCFLVGWADVYSRKVYRDFNHPKFNKRSGEMQFWTHENYALDCYQPEMIESKMKYNYEHPLRAGIVE